MGQGLSRPCPGASHCLSGSLTQVMTVHPHSCHHYPQDLRQGSKPSVPGCVAAQVAVPVLFMFLFLLELHSASYCSNLLAMDALAPTVPNVLSSKKEARDDDFPRSLC